VVVDGDGDGGVGVVLHHDGRLLAWTTRTSLLLLTLSPVDALPDHSLRLSGLAVEGVLLERALHLRLVLRSRNGSEEGGNAGLFHDGAES
jgi:hypothetical protein